MHNGQDIQVSTNKVHATNEVLREAILKHSNSVSDFCRQVWKDPKLAAMNAQRISDLINCTLIPFYIDGSFRVICLEISRALKVFPEELFPEALYRKCKRDKQEKSSAVSCLLSADRRRFEMFLAPTLHNPVQITELGEELQLAFRELSDIESWVLKLRYGIDGNERMTLPEIGEKFGLLPQLIHRIENQAIDILRNSKHAPSLMAFMFQ